MTPKGGSEGVVIEGPLAAVLRRGAYWYRQPTDYQKLSVGRSWLEAVASGLQSSSPEQSNSSKVSKTATSSDGNEQSTSTSTPSTPKPVTVASSSTKSSSDKSNTGTSGVTPTA